MASDRRSPASDRHMLPLRRTSEARGLKETHFPEQENRVLIHEGDGAAGGGRRRPFTRPRGPSPRASPRPGGHGGSSRTMHDCSPGWRLSRSRGRWRGPSSPGRAGACILSCCVRAREGHDSPCVTSGEQRPVPLCPSPPSRVPVPSIQPPSSCRRHRGLRCSSGQKTNSRRASCCP